MKDRELLEWAARAAGYTLCDRLHAGPLIAEELNAAWDPLTDDGDALRLAVKLKMVIDTDWNGGANAGNAAIDFPDTEYGYQEGQGRNDLCAATRRAIVRAAAEIGKAMP